MATWQIQQAKAQLSEVIDQAQNQGPQFITRHGTRRAALLSSEAYEQLTGKKKTLVEHLLSGPKVDGFEVARDRAVGSDFEFDLDDK